MGGKETYGHSCMRPRGRRLWVKCSHCGTTESIATGLTPESSIKKFESRGWRFTNDTATCPNNHGETEMRIPTPNPDTRKPVLTLPVEPKKPAKTNNKELVLALIEAASILDSARTSLSEYSNTELISELQSRMMEG